MDEMKNNEIPELSQELTFLGKVSKLFIGRFRIVYLIIISILILGYFTYQAMPREAMPEASMNRVIVMVGYTGVSATDMETLVTEPLENVLEGLDDLDEITSTTETGSTQIMLSFEDGTDMDDAVSDVTTEVNSTSLPNDATDPVIIEMSTSEMPIMSLTVTGDISMTELKYYGEVIQEEIEGVAGVNTVELSGGYTREIQVLLKQSELTRYGLTTTEVTSSLSNSDVSIPLSSMELEGETFNMRIDEDVTSMEDISNIVVRADDNSFILLGDIADIVDGFETPTEYSYYYINDGSEVKQSDDAIYITVFRVDGYDMVQPCSDIREMITVNKDDIVPENVNIVVTYDQSIDVMDELDTVLDSAVSGFLVVVIVLFLFIGLNESLIVASVIPLSLAISVIFLDLYDMTFNTLTLTGFIIALGLLVDNAIVILENVDRLRDMGIERTKASIAGSNQVSMAVFAASMTTIVAFYPLIFMDGTIGEMVRALPLTIVFSIIASFIVSIAITPALTSRFLSKYKGGHKNKFTKRYRWIASIASAIFVAILTLIAFDDFGVWAIPFAIIIGAIMFFKQFRLTYGNKAEESVSLATRYKELLGKIMAKNRRKLLVIVMSMILFAGSVSTLVTGMVSFELFPVEDPDSMTITITAPDGYLLDDTREIVYKVEEKLFEYDDIESFNSSMGSSGSGSIMSGSLSSNEAEISIELKEDRVITGLELMDLIREDVSTIAGAEIILDATISKGPSSEDISMSFKGDDRDVLDSLGAEYYEQLISIEGIVNPSFSSTSAAKELVIKVDNLKAARYGYTAATLSQELRNKIDGISSITYTDGDDEVDITVYVDKEEITSIKDFEKLYFTGTNGESFSFTDVAELEISNAVSSIDHEDGTNIVTVAADVGTDYDLTTVMREFMTNTSTITLPDGVEEAQGGGFNDMQETLTSMLIGVGVAVLLVYIILSIQFNSLHQPLVILVSLPLAVTGVMIGLVVTGNNLGFYAMMGVIALVGIAVNDAIVLIDYMNYLREAGMEKSEAVLEGVRTRFIPVFTTSITTIGGMLPLAVFNDTYGQLGIALIFGLIASTFLTLLVIPVVYSVMDTFATFIKRKTGIFSEH